MKVAIIGLRRSGTTIVWRSLCQSLACAGYNEPFNPLYESLPAQDELQTRADMIEIWRENPERFQKLFAPIERLEELRSGLTKRQHEYFAYLSGKRLRWCMNTTRCHYKLNELKEIEPDLVLVHLYRHPFSFVTSHMVPSRTRRGVKASVKRWLLERDFWSRTKRYDFWHVEEVTRDSTAPSFKERLREAGFVNQPADVEPAVAVLLKYWSLHYRHAEEIGPQLFGRRFISCSFESCCRDPAVLLRMITGIAGPQDAPSPANIETHIHPPNPPFQPTNPSWREFARVARVPDEFLVDRAWE